jgi:hypothetical protein
MKYVPLPSVYNVQNSVQLMKDLEYIPCTPDLRLASLDVSNMYTNIPTNELLVIIENACKNNNLEPSIRQEILRLTRLIVTQNYFKFQNKTYLRKNGLAMGAHTSSALSEIYLQFMENTKKFDILIIYDENHTNIEEVQKSFNDITTGLHFTLEQEEGQKINFLDLTITRTENGLSYDIFRKHTTTDTIIPHDSYHPLEHKMATI